MSKKRPDTTEIANELKGASLFFTPPPAAPSPAETATDSLGAGSKPETVAKPASPRHHDAMPPRYRDTTTPRYHAPMIAKFRKAVKEFGKEAATHRFTLGEKRALADIIYSYERRGLRTSENEVTRIAINFLLIDYQENGENSLLHKALAALNE